MSEAMAIEATTNVADLLSNCVGSTSSRSSSSEESSLKSRAKRVIESSQISSWSRIIWGGCVGGDRLDRHSSSELKARSDVRFVGAVDLFGEQFEGHFE